MGRTTAANETQTRENGEMLRQIRETLPDITGDIRSDLTCIDRGLRASNETDLLSAEGLPLLKN